jgi:hypothetical protein
MRRVICRQKTRVAWWLQQWVQRWATLSLSAKLMCRWLALHRKKKKGQESGNMWTLRWAEKVLSVIHFSWFYLSQTEGKGLHQRTYPELVHQQNLLSLTHLWSDPKHRVHGHQLPCSELFRQRRKVTSTSRTFVSCSRLAAATECPQPPTW